MSNVSDDQVVFYGECLEVMRALPSAMVDAVVTDPPYGLGFMGRQWDYLPPGEAWAAECLRLLKPGGFLVAFGGSRTWHRLAVAVEDAGFEIRDSIAWLYGSGFPKSLDVSKAIDKAIGAEREVTGQRDTLTGADKTANTFMASPRLMDITAPATEAAQQWEGWGTALKPAFEPIVVGRKPFPGTVAANVLEHGTGALNIDGCRVATTDKLGGGQTSGAVKFTHEGWNRPWMDDPEHVARVAEAAKASVAKAESLGRWPTNVVLDESQAAELDKQTGVTRSRVGQPRGAASGDGWGMTATGAEYDDQGGASRFFPVFKYQAKAPARERPKGADGKGHPTVKPLEFMRWLVRLVTPPGGLVLDTFAGSGTTGEACALEGFCSLLIEDDPNDLPMIAERLRRADEEIAGRLP